MGLRDYIFGTGAYTVTGADPEGCLNKLNINGIPLQNIQKEDDLTYTFTAPLPREQEILTLAERSYCQGFCSGRYGLKVDLQKLLHRPFLLISLVIALFLTFSMGSLVWKIRIDAGDDHAEWKIRHVLRDLGVDIWCRTEDVDPLHLRYALLNEIPELSWVAVNPKGGKLTVLALLKEKVENTADTGPCNLVAVREGVITESTVLEGMDLVKVGDSVSQGQILVSGIEDYGLYMKLVRAEGEIYGQTWYRGTLVTPSKRAVKQYTGDISHEIRIIFGRKSINLSGSSSNLGVSCDKIINTIQLSPPGCPFPLYLQRVTYREYILQDQPMPRETAQELLCRSWESCLLSSMVAGKIQQTDSVCFEKGGLYILQGESVCEELISRPMSPEPSQKGADPIGTDH